MARVLKPAKPAPKLSEQWHKRLREAAFLLLLPLAIYLFACLLTYSQNDPGWSHAGDPARDIHNFGGAFGAWIADLADDSGEVWRSPWLARCARELTESA